MDTTRHHHGMLAHGSKPRLNVLELDCKDTTLCVLTDTGAIQSYINRAALAKLGLDLPDGTDEVVLERVALGPFVWSHLTVKIDWGEDRSQAYYGRPTHGIFGCDLMNGLCWLFDHPTRRFHVCTPDHPFLDQWTQGARSIPIRPHTLGDHPGNVWAAESFLNGHGPIHTDLDTGAQRTILTARAGELLDPEAPREAIRLGSGSLTTPSPSYRAHADEIVLAGLVFERPLVAVSDRVFEIAPELIGTPAILLGIDVIGENRYGFDLQRGRFWIHPRDGQICR